MKKKDKKTWKNIGIGVAVIIAFGFLLNMSSSSDEPIAQDQTQEEVKGSMAEVEILTNNIDLGDIPIQGGDVEAVFSFRNNGTESLKLTEGATSCMCTEAIVRRDNGDESPRIKMPGHGSTGFMNMTIEPGEEVSVTAIFDPMAHGPNGIGSITRDVTFMTNSKTSPQLRFSFRGNVIR